MSSTMEVTTTSTPEVIDVEALLAPIPGENPSGSNLQYTGLHDEIREARRSEDNLAQGEWVREMKVAQWPKVFDLTSSALASQTKDLQICAWLDEALAKLYGFEGLRDGLRLMRGLHERFWETVYPEADEGDLEGRANALSWMDRQLSLAVKELPLTAGGEAALNYLQWEESRKFDIPENIASLEGDQYERAVALKAQAEAEKRVTGEDWRRAKGAGRRAFYEQLNALLDECWAEFQSLDRVMDEKFERQTPGLGALKKSLEEVRDLVGAVLKEKRALEPDPVADGDGSHAAEGTDGEWTGGGTAPSGPVRSRQEALRRLAEVAEYFRRAEPHSPVSYLVQRAIRWGEMPLETWLQDVIGNVEVLEHLRETLGLKSPAGEGYTETAYASTDYSTSGSPDSGYSESS